MPLLSQEERILVEMVAAEIEMVYAVFSSHSGNKA
jgi:hypothetical protein